MRKVYVFFIILGLTLLIIVNGAAAQILDADTQNDSSKKAKKVICPFLDGYIDGFVVLFAIIFKIFKRDIVAYDTALQENISYNLGFFVGILWYFIFCLLPVLKRK